MKKLRVPVSHNHWRYAFWVLAAGLMPFPANANDTWIPAIGGSLTPLKEHPSIVLLQEDLSILMGTKDTQVKVRYLFSNQGAKTEVEMGFPECYQAAVDLSPL